MDWLGYIQTGIWIWGLASESAIGVLIWALITRLPRVVVAVLALGAGVLALLGLETAVIVTGKITERLSARYRRAVDALADLRTRGVVLGHRAVASPGAAQAFSDDVDAFEADALAAMKGAATPTDIAWFRHLHEWTAPVVAGYNDDHALKRAILDEKLRRMLQIAHRIEAKIG